jgi:hypothetical protein
LAENLVNRMRVLALRLGLVEGESRIESTPAARSQPRQKKSERDGDAPSMTLMPGQSVDVVGGHPAPIQRHS